MRALDLINYEGSLEEFISSAKLEKKELNEALATAYNGNWIRQSTLKDQILAHLQSQMYKVRVLTKLLKSGRTTWADRLRAPYYDYEQGRYGKASWEEARAKRTLDEEAFEQGFYNFRPSSQIGKGLYSGLAEKFNFLLNTCSEDQQKEVVGFIFGKENKMISFFPSLEDNYKKPEQVLYLVPFQELMNSIFNSRKIIEVAW